MPSQKKGTATKFQTDNKGQSLNAFKLINNFLTSSCTYTTARLALNNSVPQIFSH